MVKTEITLIIFFTAKDGEDLYGQQKQDQVLTVARIMKSLLPKSDKLKTVGKITRPFSSVQFSCSVVSDSLRPHESQHAKPPCLSPTPRVHSDSRPSSQWCHPAISSPSPPAPNPSQHHSLFQWVNSSHEVAKVLEFQLQHQSFQWTPRTDLL